MLLFLIPSGFFAGSIQWTSTGRPKRTTNSAKNNSKTSIIEPGSIREFLRPRWIAVSVASLVLTAAVAAGIIWWLHARHFEWTDDPFIDSRQFAVSSKVPGYIRDVAVTDNRKMAAGDVLVQIDDRDYRASQRSARHAFLRRLQASAMPKRRLQHSKRR